MTALRDYRRPLRILAGVAIVLHGLAHAVFAYRGSAGWQPTFAASHGLLILYTAALVMFVAAGTGMAGSRFLHPHRVWLMTGATSASIATLALAWQPDLWIGAAVDLIIVGHLLTRRRGRILPPRSPQRFIARTSEGAALVFVAFVAVAALAWPWHRTWGTTEAEWAMALPGDEPERTRATEMMHGISIDAPSWAVWAWLIQIGQDRAGFYSYERLERLAGVDIRNADALEAEWQHRREGDLIPATQFGYLGGVFGDRPGWRISELQRCRALVLEGWGSFVVLPDGPERSRLLVRSRMGSPDAPVAGAALSFLAFEIPHFIMERGMLRGIKHRVESPAGRIGASSCAGSL